MKKTNLGQNVVRPHLKDGKYPARIYATNLWVDINGERKHFIIPHLVDRPTDGILAVSGLYYTFYHEEIVDSITSKKSIGIAYDTEVTLDKTTEELFIEDIEVKDETIAGIDEDEQKDEVAKSEQENVVTEPKAENVPIVTVPEIVENVVTEAETTEEPTIVPEPIVEDPLTGIEEVIENGESVEDDIMTVEKINEMGFNGMKKYRKELFAELATKGIDTSSIKKGSKKNEVLAEVLALFALK